MSGLWNPPTSGGLDDVRNALLALLDYFRRGASEPYCPPRTVTAATTLLETDRVLLVDTTGGAVTVTLGPASGYLSQPYAVKLIAGVNNLTLDADGAENIYTTAGAGSLVWNTTGSTKVVVPCIITAPATWGWAEIAT